MCSTKYPEVSKEVKTWLFADLSNIEPWNNWTNYSRKEHRHAKDTENIEMSTHLPWAKNGRRDEGSVRVIAVNVFSLGFLCTAAFQ